MKSKVNSNDNTNRPYKLSMLVKNPNSRLKLSSIPSNLDPNVKRLDLSNKRIQQLSGIQQCRSLQTLILSNNAVENVDKLKPLGRCKKLKELVLDGNPICDRVNYIYRVICTLNRVITVDGIKLQQNWNTIQQWQIQNGKRVCQFLLQSCVILNQLSKKANGLGMEEVREQLHTLKQQFLNNEEQLDGQIITEMNRKISQGLPLKTVHIPQYSAEELNQINDYLIEKLIAIGTQQNSDMIFKLLQGVEVNNDEEQNIITKPQIAQFIIKQQLQTQSILNYQLAQAASQINANYPQFDIKHLRSVDTALDTLDTAKREISYYLHFSLDPDYLRVLNQVIPYQIDRLISVIDKSAPRITQNTVQISTFKAQYLHPHFKSYDTFGQTQMFNSENSIYKNTVILTNIVQMLQGTIKKIVLRKLRKAISNQLKNEIFLLFIRSLQRSLNKIFFQSFQKISQPYKIESMVAQRFKGAKMKRIFNGWKQIKSRKLKLVEKMLKKKVKSSTFLTAIALAKWKMNIRSQKLKRRASLALLSAMPTVVPSSKKEIELAYRRITSNKFKVL